MLGRIAFFAAAILGFAYVAVPREGGWADDLHADSQPGISAQSVEQAEAGPAGAINGWYAGDQTLSRKSDGHFYASTSINGSQAYMLVDTGASVVALTGEDAMAAGLHWDDNDVVAVARGASGTVYGVRTRLNEVTIGNLSQRNIEAIIVPEGLDISLLGQSYLGRLERVEISGDTMQLSGG